MAEREGTCTNTNDLASLLKTLTPNQLDFVRARLDCNSDAEAARVSGVAPGTVARWKAEGAPIDAVIQLAKMDSVILATEMLRRLGTKAVDVLEGEMSGRRKLDAAKDVLDRLGVTAGNKIDITSGGQPLTAIREVVVERPECAEPVPDTE